MFIQEKPFQLKSRHFHTGLTSQDFSAYAGEPVKVCYLSDFPHWSKIIANKNLSSQESKERGTAIANTLGLPTSITDHLEETSIPLQSAKDKIPFILTTNTVPTNLSSIPKESHFDDIKRNPTKGLNYHVLCPYNLNKPRLPCIYPAPPQIEPYQISPEMAAHFGFTRAIKPTIFLHKMTESDAAFWSTRSNLPQHLATNHPPSKIQKVITALHEMRHTRNIAPLALKEIKDSQFYATIQYYEELDADLFARDPLIRTGTAKEDLSAYLHTRYIDLAFFKISHWHAPALEAIENKQKTPSLEEVYEAVKTIKKAALTSVNNSYEDASFVDICTDTTPFIQDNSKQPSQESQRPNWDSLSISLFKQLPELAFNQVNSSLKSGCFKENPLAEDIAAKMVEGAHFFCPKMIAGTRVRQAMPTDYTP